LSSKCRYQIQIIHFLRRKKLGNTQERGYIFKNTESQTLKEVAYVM
jgi:hypothetical protein